MWGPRRACDFFDWVARACTHARVFRVKNHRAHARLPPRISSRRHGFLHTRRRARFLRDDHARVLLRRAMEQCRAECPFTQERGPRLKADPLLISGGTIFSVNYRIHYRWVLAKRIFKP